MRDVLRKCFVGKAGQQALEILDTVFLEMERERESLMKRAYSEHPLEPEFDGVGIGISTQPLKRARKTRREAPRGKA